MEYDIKKENKEKSEVHQFKKKKKAWRRIGQNLGLIFLAIMNICINIGIWCNGRHYLANFLAVYQPQKVHQVADNRW